MKFYLLHIILLLFSICNLNAQKVEHLELSLRDTVLPNYLRYPMAVDFVLNTTMQLPVFMGVPTGNVPFKVKQYPLKHLFSKGSAEHLNILVTGQSNNYKIVVDFNFDKDFSNEQVLSKKMLDSGFVIRAPGNSTNQQRTVRIYPFDLINKLGPAEEQKWQMTISSWPAHKYAVIKSGLAKKALFFTKISQYDMWQKESTIIFDETYDAKENNQYFTTTDSIYFSRNVFRMDSIAADGASAYFEKSNRIGKCGTALGDSLCLDFLTTENGELSLTDNKERKLVVFHFWGSWCAPCLQEMPTLEKTIVKHSYRATFINVAYETTNNLQKVKALLKKYPALGNNILEVAGKTPVTNRFGIAEFPTYIIVSPDGFLIKRISANESQHLLTAFLGEYENLNY